MSKYQITGKLHHIGETETFGSGFQKREFVIETSDDKYPQQIKFELFKEHCEQANSWVIGSDAEVDFNIRGSEYNGRYYVNLNAWKIKILNSVQPNLPQSELPVQPQQPAQQPAAPAQPTDDDSIPF